MLYFLVLYQVRDKVDPVLRKGDDLTPDEYIEAQLDVRSTDTAIQHLKFLYEPYEGQFWWWESLECIR